MLLTKVSFTTFAKVCAGDAQGRGSRIRLAEADNTRCTGPLLGVGKMTARSVGEYRRLTSMPVPGVLKLVSCRPIATAAAEVLIPV